MYPIYKLPKKIPYKESNQENRIEFHDLSKLYALHVPRDFFWIYFKGGRYDVIYLT